MHRILVDQQKITQTQMDEVPSAELQPGEARLTLESFALTANNVTYAASGFAIGYWKFFPTGVAGQGLVPVWGVAKVTESRADELPEGTRLYGFYPMSESIVITPQVSSRGNVTDIVEHRRELPAVYNSYVPVGDTTPEQDHIRAILQPLLATSYLISDWLADNDRFGAEQIIVGSASSKTGLGLCKYLAEDTDRSYKIVGLTSERNRSFVEGLGACDTVLTYDQIADIPALSSVYVDMSGNAQVKAALHAHLGADLKHSAAVGISHWDAFNPAVELEGVKPEFFFAPAQIAKRRDEWGPGEIDRRIGEAFMRLAEEAATWMEVKVHDGLDKAPAIYATLAEGTSNPAEGHVIRL
ncbi:DUF2855 domain containing protein [Sulfitobacter noctilucicola]|uniref:DUF2855 family protein n=1 Tax=Sulfitobacter noctilucicola TaxID=1342301 RepID=A0A7W6M7B7_9RHOB|nr:DUF2855 family protein [Sulfitobacter noctilucicola]KIN65102.1 DUF2855 domain containing protein [Sulfitobacter noctilucicola]MBB4173760.1 hypothetical protein [Sulfitobacter noctilucicola]